MPADIAAIAQLTWLQLRRSRAPLRHVVYVVALLALPQLSLLVKAGQPGAAGEATKQGLLLVSGVLGLSVATAVAKLVADDAAGRSLALLLTRPTSVARVLWGRCLGAVVYFFVGYAASVLCVAVLAVTGTVRWPKVPIEALVVPVLCNAAPACAIIALSLLLSPLTSMVSLLIVASSLVLLPQVLAVLVGPNVGRYVSEAIYACTPYFGPDKLGLEPNAVRNVALQVASALDQFGYAAALLCLCAAIFERRDVRPQG